MPSNVKGVKKDKKRKQKRTERKNENKLLISKKGGRGSRKGRGKGWRKKEKLR